MPPSFFSEGELQFSALFLAVVWIFKQKWKYVLEVCSRLHISFQVCSLRFFMLHSLDVHLLRMKFYHCRYIQTLKFLTEKRCFSTTRRCNLCSSFKFCSKFSCLNVTVCYNYLRILWPCVCFPFLRKSVFVRIDPQIPLLCRLNAYLKQKERRNSCY